MNTNAAKLNPESIQQARALVAARFTTQSVAAVFAVCPRSIRNVLKGRTWSHVAAEPAELPTLAYLVAGQLKLRAGAGLTHAQRDVVERYADRLSPTDCDHAREAFARELLDRWTPRRPAQRKDHRDPAADAATTADQADDAGPTPATREPSAAGAGLRT